MVKLSAPVGMSPRKGEGAPVKNAPKDVETLRLALRANKLMVPEGQKVDAGLIKAINAAQTKAGFKNPDSVVDPDGKTWKWLAPKYEAAEKAAAKVTLYKVVYRDKECMLTKSQLDKLRAEVFGNLQGYLKSLLSSHKTNMRIYQDYLDTAMLKDGYLNAVTQVIIIKAGGVKMPDNKKALDAIKAAGALERAMASKDLEKLDKALPEAEKKINAFSADVARFLKEFTGSAQTTGDVLSVTSAVCFGIVGALATPALVTGLGVSALSATLISGGGVAVLQSASKELGKHASGQKVTLFDSVKAVVIDGTIGVATAGIASKLPLGFVGKMAKRVAPSVAKQLTGVGVAEVEKILVKYMTTTGEEVIKSACSEALALLGKTLKSGKAPTEKDLEDAVQKILVTLLTAGIGKRLGGFQKKWAMDNRKLLEGKIFPDVLKKIAKSNELPPVIKAKVWADVMSKVSGELMTTGTSKVIDKMKGDESADALSKLASKEIEKDAKIRKLIEVEMTRALKKQKVEVK
ncbi:hypothetical protein [Frigidibacter sp. ROC022]|uniref:hypothetical protein n=1 Tax=Frigidibacter sp. ROC022 TaxID=2971796 RepID=UPI00215AF8B4|nr:hypothetical protein [Frigidibacter sp. ROC022]MCR8722949.1 hypothetical protein [Frigidibacter sp. ROC022]